MDDSYEKQNLRNKLIKLEEENAGLRSENKMFSHILGGQSEIGKIFIDFFTDLFEEISSKGFYLGELARIQNMSTD